MKKKNQILRSFSALLLIAAMVLGLLPGSPRSVSAQTQETTLSSASDILTQDSTVPDELGPESTYPDNVYDVAQGQLFLLSEQNELGLFVGNNGDTTLNRYNNFNLNMTQKDSDGNCWVNGINNKNSGGNSLMPDNKLEIYDDMVGLQSVGLDKDGTGRKEYIASIGFMSGVVTLVVQNAETGNIWIKGVQTADWTVDEQGESTIDYWTVDNYLAITAGDYDGDGKDTFVVYICGDGDNVKIVEYSPSSASNGWTASSITKLSSVVKLNYYQNNDVVKYKPAVSLATGDFNGDGRDQLAFSAGFFNTSVSVNNGYENSACDNLEQFASCVCVCSYNSGWKVSNPIWMYDLSENFTQSGTEKVYPLTIMHAASLAAGDVNNDGIDEIVAAGYMSLTQDDSSSDYARAYYNNGVLYKVHNVCNWSDRLACAVISADTSGSTVTYGRTDLQPFDMSQAQKYTYSRYCRDEDWCFVKLAMACGKTNGNNTAEDVFISGVLYNFADFTPTVKYTPAFLGNSNLNKTSGGEGKNSSVNWIRNVAVGNYNHNDAGREQFVFTLWQKYSGQRKYSANVGVVTGVEFEDKCNTEGQLVSYGPPKYYACNIDASDIMNNNRPYNGTDITASQLFVGGSSSINAVPVAIDIDDDGLLGCFSKRSYVYTDPEVLAVLEAGPYYSEIDDAGGYLDPCGTTYSISSGFGTGSSRTDNVSFEVGVALEASGPAIKTSLEMGYAMDWSHSYEKAYTVTTTTSFCAQTQDLVVISRVPQLIYAYDLWDAANGKWIVNGYHVRVPLTPIYYTLTIDEYNEFVEEYNARLDPKCTETLIPIEMGVDLPADHEGNPDKYWTSWSQAPSGSGAKKLSAADYPLGYGGGFIASIYETSAEQTESTEISHGFHYNLTMQGGADLAVGEAWAGGYIELNYSNSTGCSKTKIDTKESSGQVQNISASNVAGLTFAEVKSSYSFTWNFGKWEKALIVGGPKVPFYGYIAFVKIDNAGSVGPAKRRAFPPTLENVSASVVEGYKAGTVSDFASVLGDVFTVSKVSGDSHISFDNSTKTIQLTAGLTAGSYAAVFKISNGLSSLDTTFGFTLTVDERPEIVPGWKHNANGWWYQREDGTYPKNQWEKIDGLWYHFDAKGYMQTEWLQLSGKWYYLGTNGVMITGWKQISGKWYYFNTGGDMVNGWKQISGKWYYFNDSGVMVTGWKQVSGKWYYFNDSGAMQTGWQKISKKWYYFENSGAMVTGWKTISSKTYFFKSSGIMAAGEWCGGYYLNADGTWTYQYKATWRKNANGWWFGDESGWYAKNCTITIDGKSYTFDANGYWVQ